MRNEGYLARSNRTVFGRGRDTKFEAGAGRYANIRGDKTESGRGSTSATIHEYVCRKVLARETLWGPSLKKKKIHGSRGAQPRIIPVRVDSEGGAKKCRRCAEKGERLCRAARTVPIKTKKHGRHCCARIRAQEQDWETMEKGMGVWPIFDRYLFKDKGMVHGKSNWEKMFCDLCVYRE